MDRVVAMTGGATDKTREAVERWISALPAETYEIGVGKHSGGDMQRRTWSPDELRKSLGWLARENSRGADIYARPNTTRYILVDDLKQKSVDQMKVDGYEPAVITETSPGNLQAWVDLGTHQQKEIATAVAQGIAQRYDADSGAAAWRQLGRLPGYTNRKPEHAQQRNGRWQYPFVLVREAAGQVASKAHALVKDLRERMEQRAREAEQKREQSRRRQAVANAPTDCGPSQSAAEAFAGTFKVVEERAEGDTSRADFMAAQRLAVRGYEIEQIADAIRDTSPSLVERHHAPDDYAERTARKAAGSDWVAERLSERQEQERQTRRQSHGMSM